MVILVPIRYSTISDGSAVAKQFEAVVRDVKWSRRRNGPGPCLGSYRTEILGEIIVVFLF